MSTREQRYTSVAILLHWLIALAIVLQLASGLWMADAINDPEQRAFAFQVYQWHKSLGLTVLVLSLLRLVWRLIHRVPPLPEGMSAWQRLAATGTHWLFYTLMIGIPVTGWLMVSASPFGIPTLYFGLFEVPHLPLLSELPRAEKPAVEGDLKSIHEILGYLTIGLLLLHIAAALKHQLVDRDGLLGRMLPFLRGGA